MCSSDLNTRYEPEKMPMEKIGLYEGYTHVANLFLSELEDGKVMSEIAERIWEILEMESECDGGVTKLCSGDLAVRIFGYRGQKLQQVAEKIKKLWADY